MTRPPHLEAAIQYPAAKTQSPSPTVALFDSGVGGLSVWREVVRQLPHVNTLYLADQAHVPYGPRSADEIRAFSRDITDFLLAQGADLIVVACNTASGVALHALRREYADVPFVGMEPAVKPAAEHTANGVVGVIATPTTFQGTLFRRLAERFGADVRIITQVCPGLVEAVEGGDIATPETRGLLETYLAPLLDAGIDQLVLGCTHYPFLRAFIEDIVGPGVAVIDPAPAVARQAGRLLGEFSLTQTLSRGEREPRAPSPEHTLYTTGNPDRLLEAAHTLVGYTGPVVGLTWRDSKLQATDGSLPCVGAPR